jgi:uncharacterized protein involved in exopolysaccharide biosynthesis
MNPRQILLILRLRWLIVLGTLLAAVALALIISLMLPKQYTAETSLLLDTRGGDPLLATLVPNFAMPAHMATQTEILQSERVAGRVVKILGLAQNAKAVEQWREETQGRIPLETYFGSLLQRGLKVEPGRGSSLLTVSFTGTDPKFAAAGASSWCAIRRPIPPRSSTSGSGSCAPSSKVRSSVCRSFNKSAASS